MRAPAIALFVLCAVTGGPAGAGIPDDLDVAQRAELDKGELVVRSKDVEGGPWPQLMVYTRVDAPVAAVEKVFRDYAGAASYIPNLTAAEVIERPDPDTYVVRYTQKVPILGQTSNTVRNTYSHPGNGLVVAWNLIESPHADISEGELRVEPDAKGSVLRYTNYVKPKSSLAFLAKSAALGEVKRTVSAIKSESEKRWRAQGQ